MRQEGQLPFEWIADGTRAMKKVLTFSSPERALQRTAEFYRKDYWENQAVYIQIWLEKDALSGVISEVTEEWGVPLMVTRGYSSLSFLYVAAQVIADVNRPVFLYYFGDCDPSEMDISRVTEEKIRMYAPEADITFERVAVNPEQIQQMRLPTRPTKPKDSRSKQFQGGSVELDAIPPETLRQLVRECIERHVDWKAFDAILVAERSEGDTLWRIAKILGGDQADKP
jgi:hypothetical protein